MHAVRNIRLCTKDCLCLYVCPTGATDTETGQIDAVKCTGCRACADSCPSHAISMAPEKYPPQQPKRDDVKAEMLALVRSKVKQEAVAYRIAGTASSPIMRQIAEAVGKSNRLMAEDLLREAGFMLPQSGNVHQLLQALLDQLQPDDFPSEVVKQLLASIPDNETAEQKSAE